MRHTIAYEGVDLGLGYVIAHGAINFPDKPVPVTWNYNTSDPKSIWGTASDFRRDTDGRISAELEFSDEYQEKVDAIKDVAGAGFWIRGVRQDIDQTPPVIVTSELIGVSLVVPSGYGRLPWTLKDDEEGKKLNRG